MRKRIVEIFNGIADGIFPSIRPSIKKQEDGTTEVNRARLTASVLSWILVIAFLKGWITAEQVASLLIKMFTLGNF